VPDMVFGGAPPYANISLSHRILVAGCFYIPVVVVAANTVGAVPPVGIVVRWNSVIGQLAYCTRGLVGIATLFLKHSQTSQAV
jgi:hypothetical protein